MGSLHLLVTIPQLLNMKSMILFAVFLAVAAAAPAPQDEKPIILIVKQSQNHDTEKQEYSFSYETENGISVSESGVQKQIGDKPEEAGTVSQGKFSYPEGAVTYTITWVADENGFQATGDHLPTPPPMPEHVVKMLADLKAWTALNTQPHADVFLPSRPSLPPRTNAMDRDFILMIDLKSTKKMIW